MKTYEEGYRYGYDKFMEGLVKVQKGDKKLMDRLKRWEPSGSSKDPYKEGFKDGWIQAKNGNTGW